LLVRSKSSYAPAALLFSLGFAVLIYGAYVGLYYAWQTALPSPNLVAPLETLQSRSYAHFGLSLAGLVSLVTGIVLAVRKHTASR
jgi:hypothetical protein